MFKNQLKVIAEAGQKHVYSLTSCERDKTYTIAVCALASGNAILPMIISQEKNGSMYKEGVIQGTLFRNCVSAGRTQELYLEWFKFFIIIIPSIPAVRPVLLLEDGHSSHITIEWA